MKTRASALFFLFISITINFWLLVVNEKTTSKANAAIAAQRTMADILEAEEHQINSVYKTIKTKNKHIPNDVVYDMAKAVIDSSIKYNIGIDWLLRIYHVESRTVHIAPNGTVVLSLAGAKGVAQVMPFWAKSCPHANKASDLNYATINIKCGAFVLRHYLNKYNDNIVLALVAYNGGIRGVNAYKRGRPYQETQLYLKGMRI